MYKIKMNLRDEKFSSDSNLMQKKALTVTKQTKLNT